MNVSLQLILDELGYEYDGFVGADDNPVFTCAELLASHGSDLTGRKLLVCSLSEVLNLSERNINLYFLCIRDRMVDANETPDTMRGVSIIKKNIDLRELFNEVQRIFVRISDWIIDMQRSVMRDEGLQALITLTEEIIGNHISVMDPTFKLLAYTKNIDTDDPASNSIIQYGYHPDETVRQMRLHQRFAEYEKEDGIIISDDYVISNYVTVKKIFHNRGSYTILVVMVCNVKPPTGGLIDLFHILLNNLQTYVNRDYPPEGDSGPSTALICDILEHKVSGEEETRARAANASLVYQADFDLFYISFDDILNTPLNRLVQSLSNLIQNSHIIAYQRGILILNRYDIVRAADRNTRLKHVINAIHGLSASCGISTRFSTLRDLTSAHEQATTAFRLGLRLRKRTEVFTDIPDHGQLYFFEDYALFSQALHHLTYSRDGLRNTFSYNAIQKLASFDNNHQVSLLQILHTHLRCERRATVTCSLLHMHRNTVLYHINRIEEILDISLDDPDVRLKLLLGFKIRELETLDDRMYL